jgi:cytidylate kinase
MSTEQQSAPNAPSRRLVIAVDGPAASGKGTLGARLAAHFDLPHLDTGALYRSVGKKTLALKQQRTGSAEMLLPWDPTNPNTADTMFAIEAALTLRGDDITDTDLTGEWIGQAASMVSAIPEVRAALLDYQRHFAAQEKGAVLDGRDIGTVICPDATIKFFITASAEVRAERRHKQQPTIPYEDILEAIRARDARDTSRTSAPLKVAEDAITIETSTMTADEVFEKSLFFISNRVCHNSISLS